MPAKITWLGHSTVHVRLEGGAVILIDPWLENPKFPQGFALDRVDLLLLTHAHFDHIADAVETAKRFKPQVAAIYELAGWLESKGVENTTGMNKGGGCDLAGCRVTMTHAQHSSSIQDGERTLYAGEAAGFTVKVPDGRCFYHAGDTNVFSDMQLIKRLHRPELCMLPIGDLYTMDPAEAALACGFLEPKQVLPLHYGTFPPLTGRPEKLRELLGPGSSVEVLEPKPGDSFDW